MKLVIRRDFDGIGDWLLTLQVMKMLNRQYPELALHVDPTCYESAVHLKKRSPLPQFIKDAFLVSDVRFSTARPQGEFLDSGHLVYRWPPPAEALLVEDMVHVLNERTGLNLQCEPFVYPRFPKAYSLYRLDSDIAMVAHAKAGAIHGKDWGYQNFIELNRLLSAPGRSIVQLGSASDEPLSSAHRLLGHDFTTVVTALKSTRLFIGLEDGLMHLAGMLGVPQITIFTGNGLHDHIYYPNQMKLFNPTPAEVVAVACKLLKEAA